MQYKNGEHWREIRCNGVRNGQTCRALLGMEYVFTGRLSIKCHKCNHVNTIRFRTPKKLLEPLVEQDSAEYQEDES